MRTFVDAIQASVASHNWYSALALSLSVPDICGRLEEPSAKSQARFEKWYDKYLLSRYQGNVGPERSLHTFLSASDCYALRCAFLHQGEFGVEDQRARRALTHFQFTAPRNGWFVHKNQHGAVLQLQVDRFCLDVCEGTEQWLTDVVGVDHIQGRINSLATIT